MATDLISGNFFYMLVDSSIDAIVAVDMAGKITAWNKAAEAIYGKTKQEAINNPLTKIIEELAGDAGGMHGLELAFSGFKSFLPADNSIAYRRHIETHCLPLYDQKEQVGVMQLVHDVSHRIKAERLLEELNNKVNRKNDQLEKALDEMAAFTLISNNNIKIPIRSLYTDVEFLIKAEAQKLTDPGKATFRRMQSSLNKMNLVLDDMLQLSEVSIVRPGERVDINAVLRDVLGLLENTIIEKNADIQVGDLCTVAGDTNLLHKLFFHLVSNAVKFNESGRPMIKISCEEVIWDPPSVPQSGNYYKITIEDNGIGIAEEDIERAFVLFETVHRGRYKGSGLGLTMARKIMHLHNGFITLHPGVNSGISCSCYFPSDPENT